MSEDWPGYVEDWLPLMRGGHRRFFQSIAEYAAARTLWVRMNRHEREAHLAEREQGTTPPAAEQDKTS